MPIRDAVKKGIYYRAYYAANKDKFAAYRRNAEPRVRDARIITRRAAAAACPAQALLTYARARAKAKGIPFNIVLGDIRIPEKCPVLGIVLSRGEGVPSPASPTIDRINNARGYVPGNIIVISHRANSMKRDATWQELRALADFYEQLEKGA